eukprot:m.24307 g.24307  ORF g.24307 m.24307 type:complete len:340 (-) comp5638_c0_seq3:1682-2701(-)
MPKKKKGSAKGKKSAKGKRTKAAEEKPPLAWPWAAYIKSWGGGNPITFNNWRRVMRSQYVECEGIITTQTEWEQSLHIYKLPFDNLKAEAMVQMLVTLLLREGDRKVVSDDPLMFAAAIRNRHNETHFLRMFDALKAWFDLLDDPSMFTVIISCFNPSEFNEDQLYVPRSDLESLIELQLVITLGLPKIEPDPVDDEKEPEEIPLDLFEPLADYMTKNRLRLTDFFFSMDKNGDGKLSYEEITNGMKAKDLPITDEGVTMLLKDIDHNGDGFVQYKEINRSRFKNLLQRRRVLRSLMEKDSVPDEQETNDVPEEKIEVLRMTLQEFTMLILNCHYTTRP